MRIIKKTLWFLLLAFIVAQFFGPEKNEGSMASLTAFYEETNPLENVKLILQESCFDCHSSVTRYPWYNNITPVNYWMANHIKEGSKHLNFSKWEGTTTKRKDHKFEELIEMVEKKEMPLLSYTWTHKEANLTDDQINSILSWARQVRLNYSALPKSE